MNNENIAFNHQENLIHPSANYVPLIKNNKEKIANKDNYREKMESLFYDLHEIIPIDNEINNVIYLNRNIEKGFSISNNLSSLKQLWTEYRLIYNESISNNKRSSITTQKPIGVNIERNMKTYMENKDSYVLNNFDEIFKQLNEEVDGVNGVINQLENMKQKVASSNLLLETNKKTFDLYMKQENEKLMKEKEEFELLKSAQEKKLKEENDKISEHYQRIKELISKLNNQINSLKDNNI